LKTWLEPQPVSIPADIGEAVGGHPLVSEVLLRRGFDDLERIQAFLEPNLYTSASAYDLDDMGAAVERLQIALKKGEQICVWGDFDVDGQTATTLLVSALQELGAKVTYHIPLRSKESHGINLPVLGQIIAGGIDLLLTCDTGISEYEAVEYAHSKSVEVIITDHHDLPAGIPEALAVINPKRGSVDHPLHNLPGVGVAYKLAQALFERMAPDKGPEEYLDLVALGIVADLALQSGDVRYLLQRGLEQLRQPSRLGLLQIMDLAEIDPAGLTEEHIGFELAPRLNALGRLGDANLAVELLTTTEKSKARMLATQLEGLNAERKLITNQVYQAAEAQIKQEPALLEDAALVLSHPAWPGGVIGIVASRLVERYSRPVLLINSPPGELARGSARSVPGVNISAAIAAQSELLAGFGGHPMAAGFALQAEKIPDFRRGISRTVAEMVSAAQYEPELEIDGFLPLADLSLEIVADLERLAPFGPGNPNLTLVSQGLIYIGRKPIGRREEHLLVSLIDESGDELEAIWWGGGLGQLPDWLVKGAKFDLAYTPRSRDYRGKKEVQIEWLDARPPGGKKIERLHEQVEIQVYDHRDSPQALGELKLLLEKEKAVVWAEAQASERLQRRGIATSDRLSLEQNKSLVIWTIPPGSLVLRSALEQVSPEAVHLFAVDPQLDRLEPFIKRLAGLVKYALSSNQGVVEISTLAAATAQRDGTVRAGIEWLAARGDLAILSGETGEIKLAHGDKIKKDSSKQKLEILQGLLSETAAYRAHYSRTQANLLVNLATGG
jgi:single-stranded-DNA-specific exonuclease